MSLKASEKNSSGLDRVAARLNPRLDRNLLAYAAAAAGGIGLWSLAQPCEAAVVYTPAHVVINPNSGFVPLDVNNDGHADFLFYSFEEQADLGFHIFTLTVTPAQASNRAVVFEAVGKECPTGFHCAADLGKGRVVGQQGPFQSGKSNLYMAFSQGSASSSHPLVFGPWLTKSGGYLGLKFIVNGETHFGWARLKFSDFFQTTLTGYAYESTPNKAVIVGQTSGADETSNEHPVSGASLNASGPGLGQLAQGSRSRLTPP